jgi:hypothetical protein
LLHGVAAQQVVAQLLQHTAGIHHLHTPVQEARVMHTCDWWAPLVAERHSTKGRHFSRVFAAVFYIYKNEDQ